MMMKLIRNWSPLIITFVGLGVGISTMFPQGHGKEKGFVVCLAVVGVLMVPTYFVFRAMWRSMMERTRQALPGGRYDGKLSCWFPLSIDGWIVWDITPRIRGILGDEGDCWGRGGTVSALEVLPVRHRRGLPYYSLHLSGKAPDGWDEMPVDSLSCTPSSPPACYAGFLERPEVRHAILGAFKAGASLVRFYRGGAELRVESGFRDADQCVALAEAASALGRALDELDVDGDDGGASMPEASRKPGEEEAAYELIDFTKGFLEALDDGPKADVPDSPPSPVSEGAGDASRSAERDKVNS